MTTSELSRATGFAVMLAFLAGCGGAGGQSAGAQDPETVSAPAGTEAVAQLNEELSTRSRAEGDTFTAEVAAAVTDSGETVIPAGAVVHGEVTGVQRADDSGRKGVLSLDIASVEIGDERHPLQARVVSATPEVRSETSTGEAAASVGGGAAAGAILGRVIGGDATGTAVGAAVGAAAGTGVVLATSDGYAVLPEGSNVRLELTERLTVPAAAVGSEAGTAGEDR